MSDTKYTDDVLWVGKLYLVHLSFYEGAAKIMVLRVAENTRYLVGGLGEAAIFRPRKASWRKPALSLKGAIDAAIDWATRVDETHQSYLEKRDANHEQ